MARIFGAMCPKCSSSFVVAWELRYGGRRLVCPGCHMEFLPEEGVELDERVAG